MEIGAEGERFTEIVIRFVNIWIRIVIFPSKFCINPNVYDNSSFTIEVSPS